MCNMIVLDVATALVNFEKRSVITSTYCLPIIALRSVLRMAIGTNSNAPLEENNCRGRQYLSDSLCHAQSQQSLTFVCTPLAMCGQKYSFLRVSFIPLSTD